MFGYITPHICELKVGEHNIYKAVYCSLCKSLKKNYGRLFSLFLNYDMVFFILLNINFTCDTLQFEQKRCFIHPLKKRTCLKETTSVKNASDLTVILTYYKLKDQIKDEKFSKKLLAHLFLIIIKKPFKKASAKQPNFKIATQNLIEDQNKVELQKNSSLDAACHPTANFLSEIFKNMSKEPQTKQALQKFGYMLGRFIYLIDAADDIIRDFKRKNFNPFLTKLPPNKQKELNKHQQNEIFKNAYHAINLTHANLIQNFYNIKLEKLKPIISNIVIMGLKFSQKRIFEKHNQQHLFNGT